MYTTFRSPSPTESTQRLTSSQASNVIVKQMHLQTPPSSLHPRVQEPVLSCNKNVYSAIDELKESTVDENIYEELKKRKSLDPNQFLDTGSNESYDRLDFSRPMQDLKPHYQSTDTLRSRSRNSSDPTREDKGVILEESFESQQSEADFCQSVLTSVENLNASETGTRKTIYEPETDSGVSSNRSTTTAPWGPGTTTTAPLGPGSPGTV